MTAHPTLRRARSADREQVFAAFLSGAVDDPVTAWLLAGYPPRQFLNPYAGQLIDTALNDGEIWIAEADGRIRTVSLWQTITTLDGLAAEAEEVARLAAAEPESAPLRRSAYLTNLLAREHPRRFPHSYLQVIATTPEFRNRGAGALLLRHRAGSLARTALPAFLEASSERSARLYERIGFRRTDRTFLLPENGPTLIPMWLEPDA
ncbi:GNAT family N-acetyltransferase [Nocardia sp. CA-290969]|uniref:GNAT family N-acetyltransferase n=1 Tax=Nocardia sp. CA-290969 TaxID=3239986 RepID=UPI003D8B0242